MFKNYIQVTHITAYLLSLKQELREIPVQHGISTTRFHSNTIWESYNMALNGSFQV